MTFKIINSYFVCCKKNLGLNRSIFKHRNIVLIRNSYYDVTLIKFQSRKHHLQHIDCGLPRQSKNVCRTRCIMNVRFYKFRTSCKNFTFSSTYISLREKIKKNCVIYRRRNDSVSSNGCNKSSLSLDRVRLPLNGSYFIFLLKNFILHLIT